MGSVSLEPLRTPLGRHAGARMASVGGLVTREAKEGGVGGFRSCPKGAKKNSSETTPLSSSSSILSGRTTGFKLRKRRLTEDLEPVKEEEDEEEVEEEEEDGMVVKKGGGGVRIMVHVRLRPMSKAEKEAGSRSCVRVVNKREIYLTEFSIETDYLRLKRLKGRHFVFDAAFPDDSSQQEVYDASTAELVEAVVQGRNGSVFCYGATGAGKTYTMLGTIQNPGVMVLALKDLFSKLKQISKEGQYVVHLSYLEVYNETVKDLLSPGRPLILREDSKQGIVAAGLTQYQAYSADEVMALLQQGNQNRTTEPTRANETSSRSHAILQVVAEYKLQTDSGSISRAGKLSLIDLAGSERSLATDHCTIRTLEGANINRSLLSLSSCINALVEGKKHIPYRNSKLTQLLKDSLGGVCQTSMIANICPSNLSFGETQNTLHWADRAKEIRTKACMVTEELPIPESESEKAKLLLELQEENKGLRMQLAKLQQRLLSAETNALLAGHNQETPPALPLAKATVSRPSPSPTLSPYTKRRRGGPPLSSEALIEELQRKVKTLETEKDKLQQDFKLREEKLAASLNQEHRVHLRRKDDLIRSLCQKGVAMEDGSKENAKPKGGGDLIKLSPLESICEKKKLEPTSKAPPKPSNLPPMAARRLSIVPPARANASNNKASMSARRLSVSASTKPALERPTRSSFARRLSTSIETPANTKATSMPARRLSIAPSSIITKPVLEKTTRAAFSRRLSTPIEAPTTSNKAASMAARRLSIAPLTTTTTTTTTTTSTARKVASERPKISVTVKVSKVACPCPPPAKTPVQPSALDGDKRKRREASRIPLHSSPRTPRTCSPLNDVAMTTQLRKRTFWDITNANSPTTAVGRCTRSNLMATPPSMLLQPGFLSSRRSRR